MVVGSYNGEVPRIQIELIAPPTSKSERILKACYAVCWWEGMLEGREKSRREYSVLCCGNNVGTVI